MNSDKNYSVLEKQLKTLGQKIRLDILTKLDNYKEPISYSVLQKEVLGKNSNSTNFSFHLKTLKRHNLINSTDNGYSLSSLGKQILQKILSIGQILSDQNRTIIIRTSKYSTEPFNTEKIEQYLIKEGKLDKSLSKHIAHQVEERLSKTRIMYLTTPLMREYINGILLENGLEEARHRLTRLGTPPYEVEKYFKDSTLNPEQFINQLGSESSEQFLLLNLLPKNLSDLYLSGDIVLNNLNYWSLRPLSLYVKSDSILNIIKGKIGNQKQLLISFFDTINQFKPYLSADIVLAGFVSNFFSQFENDNDFLEILKLIYPFIFQVNYRPNNSQPYLTIDFSNVNDKENNRNALFFKVLITSFIKYAVNDHIPHNEKINFPFITYDYSFNYNTKEYNACILKDMNSEFYNNLIFYNGKKEQFLNSQTINFLNPDKQNRIILDKIFVNLHKISLDSKKKDDLFLIILKERLEQIFELYQLKKQLISKKLNNSKDWNNLCSLISDNTSSFLLDNSIKSISFIGLNKAIEHHCGIELDRIETSEKFACKILKFMLSVIKEKNTEENELYTLSQPHYHNFINQATRNGDNNGLKFPYYTPNIVRESSNLTLAEKIQLHKRFEDLLYGGVIFEINSQNCEQNPIELYKLLTEAQLNAFRIN